MQFRTLLGYVAGSAIVMQSAWAGVSAPSNDGDGLSNL